LINSGFHCSGNMIFGASVEDTQVNRGKSIRLSLACINNTRMKFRSVNVQLVEKIDYQAFRKKHSDKIILTTLDDVILPSLVTTNESPSNGQRNSHASDALLNHNRDLIIQSLTSGQNIISINVPRVRKHLIRLMKLIFMLLTKSSFFRLL
jgi:hypothetical protein